ncbi:Glycosyltransferase involved in cell wall bisynthesis [Natronoarchaeum philippinense]|uniref:Glycosyltransferase involved in cell wall bisynthesis n=1 Tax=Natronoarchaeum philippinense TaxID=558529 RepID=A0A285NBG0_NATPI|nr:glycosyltransferase family 4 protein [Natronoarchaeum philippinense]SNZ06760.1 Glycosyltransferase involved in cell wall bisynthesis [Natronoarchaeum philippinense]
MNPDTADVAMLHQDPHPAHRGFAEAVGADLIDYHRLDLGPLDGTVAEDAVSGLTYPEYDVYLVEGSRPLYAALTRRFARSGKLVYLAADHGLYELGSSDFEGDSTLKSLAGRFGRPAARALGRRGIDGVVAVSDFVAEFTRPFVGPETPIEIAHPFVQPETYDALGGVEPNLDANVAVTVARPWRYKGVDLLVETWPAVREEHPDAELHVVGKGHPESYAETPGVRVRGFVENLADAFAPASLFVQPSRVDAFPVSTLEAMRAGVPPLVTQTAGTRSEARQIDDSLVVGATPGALAEGVCEYFGRGADERREFADRARERGARFDADTRTAAFREAFRAVLKAL